MQHRYSMIAGGALAVAIGLLLLVLGTADDAAGRGATVPPVGDGTGSVDPVPVGGAFQHPVNVAFAPGQPSNFYVVEQDGTVEVVVGGVQQPAPFLDISGVTDRNGEQGLLSIAFHPRFASNGLVYAYYTDADNGDIVVSEFEAGATAADEQSRREVVRIRHRFASNHNGGQVQFGPDGFMYLATGDGGDAGDPRENAQDKSSLLGKLLRINPLDPPGPRAYRVPESNPFHGRWPWPL